MDKRFTEVEMISMFQQVFNGKNGEAVLSWFKVRYGDKSSHVAGDSHGTAFNEGQRSVYLQIMQFMNKDIKQLEEVQKEE